MGPQRDMMERNRTDGAGLSVADRGVTQGDTGDRTIWRRLAVGEGKAHTVGKILDE
jgi:hypothetical protein